MLYMVMLIGSFDCFVNWLLCRIHIYVVIVIIDVNWLFCQLGTARISIYVVFSPCSILVYM